MKRVFSFKEKVMLIILAILIIVLLYIFVVHIPVKDRMAEAKRRTEDAGEQITIEEGKAARIADMQTHINESADNKVKLADFDNISNVVSFLNGLMANTESYNLTFYDPVIEEDSYIVSREIFMAFACDGYDGVKNIINRLENSPYFCEITDTTMNANNEFSAVTAGRCEAQLTVVFYEYREPGE